MSRIANHRVVSMLAFSVVAGGAALLQVGCVESVDSGLNPNTDTETSASASLDATSALSAGWTRFPGAHWCISTGFDAGGYQGVVCTDLDYQTVSGGRKYNVSVELKCGTSAGAERCISAMAKARFHVDTIAHGEQTARCVASDNPCNADVTVFPNPDTFTVAKGDCPKFYTTVDARSGAGGFTLPDGAQRFTSQLFTTPKIKICGG